MAKFSPYSGGRNDLNSIQQVLYTLYISLHKEVGPQSTQCAGPVRFVIFCSVSIFILARLEQVGDPSDPPEAIFTNSSRTLFAKCSQTYSYLLRQGWGWGRGEVRIPPAAPTPLTLPYTLLYICTVHELCSRTVGEYRLGPP